MSVVVPPKRSLTERLKAATKGSRANLMPEDKPKKEVEVVPDLRQLVDRPLLRQQILRITRQIYEFGVAEREAKAGKKPLVDRLKIILEEEGIDAEKFMADELRVLCYEVPRSTINMQKLLEHGVSPKIIKESTDTTMNKTLKVSMPGGKGDDDES